MANFQIEPFNKSKHQQVQTRPVELLLWPAEFGRFPPHARHTVRETPIGSHVRGSAARWSSIGLFHVGIECDRLREPAAERVSEIAEASGAHHLARKAGGGSHSAGTRLGRNPVDECDCEITGLGGNARRVRDRGSSDRHCRCEVLCQVRLRAAVE